MTQPDFEPQSAVSPRKRRNIDRQIAKNRQVANLNAEQIGDEGVLYLSSKSLTHITTIKLWKNEITYQGIACLNGNEWSSLKSLYLNSNRIGNKGCRYLAQGPWDNLQVLSLYANEIDSFGCSHLAKKHWKNLVQLGLDNNRIKSFNELNLIYSEKLKRVILDLNPITFLGYMTLLKSQWRLQELNLINNFFREKSQELRKHLRQKYAELKGISF